MKRKTKKLDFRCTFCGINTLNVPEIKPGCNFVEYNHEYYMVKDCVWKEAFCGRGDLSCISCLEKRLRRRLIPEDFTDAPVNTPKFLFERKRAPTYKLLNRLGLI